MLLLSSPVRAAEPELTIGKTTLGAEYGLWGRIGNAPVPTLIILASDIETTLKNPYYRQCGNQLVEQGWLLVSVDLPCHGKFAGPGTPPPGLSGWSHVIGANENLVHHFNERLTDVLDHLINNHITDPGRIAVAGTSRGGFMAIHFAAHDQRVRCAAGFCPVTDLTVLSEFRNHTEHPLVNQLSLANQAEKLAGRAVLVMIGDQDERVSTDKAIEFTRKLSAAAKAKSVQSQVELHVFSDGKGHSTPPGAPALAAEWIDKQCQELPKPVAVEPAKPNTKEQTLLLVDDHHVLYRSGTQRVFYPAKLNPTNPVVKEDQPWEMAIGWTSIVRHPETGKYQLWYQAYGGGRDPRKTHRCVVCLAESDDGIAFTKPKLGVHNFDGQRFGLGMIQDTNIVLLGSGGYGDRYANSVLFEPHDPDPNKRYKMLYTDFSPDQDGQEWPGFHAAFSPDGIHWTNAPQNPLNQTAYGGRGLQPPFLDEAVYHETQDVRKNMLRKAWHLPLTMSDAADVFYDPRSQMYVVYGKCWIQGPAGTLAWKHAMARVESRDFLTWSAPQIVSSPDDQDPPNTEFHTSPVFFYKDCYFCLNQILSARAEAVGAKADAMHIELMISRDGFRWERPFRDQPFIASGEQNFSNGGIFTNTTPIFLEDTIRFYYGGYNSGAIGGGQKLTDPGQQSGVGFASIPLDRFAGIRPVPLSAQSTLRKPLENIGQITLKPLDLKDVQQITINGDAGPGTIHIELLTETGFRVRGFSREDSVPMKGDSLAHEVAWKQAKLADLPPGKYLVRLHLDNAEVFGVTLR